jgi:hypothetical protein
VLGKLHRGQLLHRDLTLVRRRSGRRVTMCIRWGSC